MKLSAQWIRDFVDLTVDNDRLAEALTNVGISVEGISGSGADTVFEMEIGTNRPDAMNHYGVAREAAAIYDAPLKAIDTGRGTASAVPLSSPKTAASAAEVSFPITVEEPQLCPRFSARVIRNTKIKPSPENVAHRLQLLDQRPISNAVDATNYVLWDIGKPTHVFDADLLEWLARGRRLLLDGQGLVRARRTGALVLDADFDRSLLRHVTVLKLAEEEAEAVGDLQSLGVPEILVTEGPNGSTVITPDGVERIPARWIAADPTGAGDAFAVAYLGARASGHSPSSAARRATALVAALLEAGAQ